MPSPPTLVSAFLTRGTPKEPVKDLMLSNDVYASLPHVSPRAFPELRVPAAGAPFVYRVDEECKVTHLSMYVPRASARDILARITGVLGEQLVALRVVRSFLVPAGGSAFWKSDSPVSLCGALRAPALRVFELKDQAQAPATMERDIRHPASPEPGNGPAFSTSQCSRRTPAGSTPIKRWVCEWPVEVWESFFAQLSWEDQHNLTKVEKRIGAIAESILYREVKLTADRLVSWTEAVTMAATHRATAVRCLTISMDRVEGLCESANATICLAGALASLPDLREFTILSAEKLATGATRDIMQGTSFLHLRRFSCDCDALVLGSWPALARQGGLEEFRGSYGFTSYIPADVTPRAWPNLRVMDAGATFVSRLALDNRVTHLSVHVPRATARNALARIAQIIGHQLVALRVTRTILCPHSGGCDWALPVGREPYWESDSPVVLCEALHAPRLQFLQVRDKVPNGVDWTIDVDGLRKRRTFGASFRAPQWTERKPSLRTVLYLPDQHQY